MNISLIFPNQLFYSIPKELSANRVFLIEEDSFFKKFNFNLNKLVFLRHAALDYCKHLDSLQISYEYIKSENPNSNLEYFFNNISGKKIISVTLLDPIELELKRYLKRLSEVNNFKIIFLSTQSFLSSKIQDDDFFRANKSVFRHGDYYKRQRIKHNILINDGKPTGDRWSFDKDNRKAYPKNKPTPQINYPSNPTFQKATYEINNEFPENIGVMPDSQIYPSNHNEATKWFDEFLENRFVEFGIYEDAIVRGEAFINHSVISPLLNIGLLTPKYVIDRTLEFSISNKTPINSVEGFLRQIIGWREFIRGMYEIREKEFKTGNYWEFNERMPKAFYNASTGILPVDDSIKKALRYGYNHHIERLMVLGNFMLLCEICPKEVYKWFMEMYADAYEWVMIPNVFGMSQFSDGGSFATKPYISSSNYILKMSNYPKGKDWALIWDSLFWRFMDKNKQKMIKNPRLGMLIKNFENKDLSEKQNLFKRADDYLKRIRT